MPSCGSRKLHQSYNNVVFGIARTERSRSHDIAASASLDLRHEYFEY